MPQGTEARWPAPSRIDPAGRSRSGTGDALPAADARRAEAQARAAVAEGQARPILLHI